MIRLEDFGVILPIGSKFVYGKIQREFAKRFGVSFRDDSYPGKEIAERVKLNRDKTEERK